MKLQSGLILFLSLITSLFKGQDTLKKNESEFQSGKNYYYEDRIYVPNIKTVQLHESSWELSPPLIDFDAGQLLELSFDDLDADNKSYWYTIIHCDAFWKPSNLQKQEYLGQSQEEQIQDFSQSAGPYQKYTHYYWIFPNNNIKILLTGNYLLKVYLAGKKDKPVFTKRFMVFSSKVSITGLAHEAANAEDFQNKQEVDFSVFYPGYNMINPATELKVVIQQNDRWDNAIFNIKPIFYKQNELSYDYDDGTNCFDGGNEYRYVNSKNFTFITQFVEKIYHDSLNVWQVIQKPEEIKNNETYSLYTDNNGRYIVRVEDQDSSQINADYCMVHFFLPFDYPRNDGNFYILGNLTSNLFLKENRFNFNYFTHGYDCQLYLKQGYFDYQIAFLEDGKTAADVTQIEGSHWKTENEYTVYVYDQQPGTFYDQLICVSKLNSIKR